MQGCVCVCEGVCVRGVCVRELPSTMEGNSSIGQL